MTFHDLTTTLTPSYDLHPLLGLGHKFIPIPRYSNGPRELLRQFDRTTTLVRLDRAIRIRCFFADQHPTNANPETDNNTDRQYNPRMYVPSDWEPPRFTYPAIVQRRLNNFCNAILEKFVRRQGRSNLLPHQRRALQWAQTQDNFVIALTDKNLGFCIIEKREYIQRVRTLLSDVNSYTRLSHEDAILTAAAVQVEILEWIADNRVYLASDEIKFIKRHINRVKDPFAVFYPLFKIHKTPVATRPVVSYSGSLLYALAVWCDDKLLPMAKAQNAYLSSSFELQAQLSSLQLPPNAKLFTADARAMYTNIPTRECLDSIREYLQEHYDNFTHVDHETLLSALSIVMNNNLFRFGDTYWLQNNGAAMGAPPCPSWAMMYFAPFEDDSCDIFSDHIVYYKRYIDDVFGIWLQQPGDDQAWNLFKAHMNTSALVWDFTERSRSAIFLDLHISITNTNEIHTDLYEKPLNLHAYIPPHSAHPPGVLRGMIKGMIYRFKTLCTLESDQKKHILQFYRHLVQRGYKPDGLTTIFNEAVAQVYGSSITPPPPGALQPPAPSLHPLFFHLQYHPSDPPSHDIQRIWRRTLFRPAGSRPLSDLDSSHRRGKIGIDRMIVCYSRAPNLENLVSSKRNLEFVDGPTVSSFFDD
ncbi:unnamed protein product [Cylindrotheca closterium]|uniref:Helix-turn-helix domain-containing protein n=1 Tax=Cylindrotheca closterium TaxID=2856 RepID=A0AAD2PUN4_9STRA|nr:unnamed protein product [Cylindrotheca closterium]